VPSKVSMAHSKCAPQSIGGTSKMFLKIFKGTSKNSLKDISIRNIFEVFLILSEQPVNSAHFYIPYYQGHVLHILEHLEVP
jgi:hypothetical protein